VKRHPEGDWVRFGAFGGIVLAMTDDDSIIPLALELARLDELQEVFYQRALEGDVQCGALVTKIIETRGVMLGLHTPQTAVLQIVDQAKPAETSTDRIERVLAELTAESKKTDPSTH
jgi:hypothetical protein